MKTPESIVNIEAIIFWTVVIIGAGALVTIAVARGLLQETIATVRQPERPVCTKRSCPFPLPVVKPSGLQSLPEDSE